VSCDHCRASVINNVGTHELGCTGALNFIRGGRKYQRVRVWSLDMWGDDVNDRHSLGYIMVLLDCSDRALIKALKRRGWVNKKLHYKSFSIDGDELVFYIEYKQKPVFQCEIQ
jgi:hypothetical protein